MIAAMRQRLASALHWPNAAEWLAAAWIGLVGLAAVAILAFALGLANVAPMPFGGTWLRYAAILLVVPALGEELLFRGLLVPPRGEPMPGWVAVAAILAFVLWHPLQAVTIGPPWRAAFLDPAFLLVVAVLGAMLVGMYRRCGSIWPGVLAHWFVVLGWKLIFGGPIG